MCAINKCLLYAFLCLAIFCEIDSKGQIPTDGVINIDDTLKGEVIEGSGRSNDEDDVDQEESSGLEDDEDTPLLSSMTPGVPDGRYGHGGRSVGGTDATSFEPGSGDGRQEVSKPPQTNYKFKKPDPTKFLTPFAPDENRGKPDPKENDDMNKIDHRGGTGYDDPGYDKKNPGTGDEEISNEIPVIGKAVMGPKESRTDSESLWHQPGILAGIIGAAVVGLLCAVLLVMFIVYRMRKKDEGSYDLDETTKRSPRINGYQRTNQNEFYA